MFSLLVYVAIFAATFAIPPPVPEEFRSKDRLVNHSVPLHLFRRAALKTKWVSHNGGITSYNPGNAIQVDATTSVTDHAHQVAATIISRMGSLLSGANFAKAASNTKVGVFTQAEHLTAYPEYYRYATYQCSEHQCSGSCHATCTFDNRQYYTLAGAGGARAVISDANLLCRDDYRGKSNILAHEYSHSLHRHVLDSTMKSRITEAYQNAKRNNLWSDNYAMSNEEEYFAVGVTVFFHTEEVTGGGGHSMNQCDTRMCGSEAAARYHMYYTDIKLYGILYDIFSDKPGNMKACMA